MPVPVRALAPWERSLPADGLTAYGCDLMTDDSPLAPHPASYTVHLKYSRKPIRLYTPKPTGAGLRAKGTHPSQPWIRREPVASQEPRRWEGNTAGLTWLDRSDMRANIDALVARPYGLIEDELRFIFTDFTENSASIAYRNQVLEKFQRL